MYGKIHLSVQKRSVQFLDKRPLPPTLSRVRSKILSPVVFMVTSSM